jgi:hypothetical protein
MEFKKEFNIHEVEYIVVKVIKKEIKIKLSSGKMFLQLDKDIRKAVKEYNKKRKLVRLKNV